MRKAIHIMLGALIALLAGCKTQQKVVQKESPMVMYGPPSYFQQDK